MAIGFACWRIAGLPALVVVVRCRPACDRAFDPFSACRDAAAGKVAELVAEEGNPDLKLRVFVQGGGCSGFQYGFTFDEIVNEDDTTMVKNGVQLLIDSMSYQYLVGAEIDYKDDLEGAQFVIKNPQATSTCGCGSSFSV